MKTYLKMVAIVAVAAVGFSARPAQAQVSLGIATPGFALGVGPGAGFVGGGYPAYGYPVIAPPIYAPRPIIAPPIYGRPYYGGYGYGYGRPGYGHGYGRPGYAHPGYPGHHYR